MKTDSGVKTAAKFYAENSTVHGVSAVFGSPTKWTKLFFVLLIAVLLPCVLISTYSTMDSFFKYKVLTSIDTDYRDRMPFPSVTICRNHMISLSQLPAPFLNATRQKVSQIINDNATLIDISDFVNNITNALQAEMENMNASFSKKPSMLLPKLKDSCVFASTMPCNLSEDFKPTFPFELDRCYTFHHQKDPKYIQMMNGHLFGLQLVMFLNQSDIVPLIGTREGAGFTIYIHPRGTVPSLINDGIYVAPGFNTLITLTQTEINLKRHPYASNCTDGKGVRNYFPGKYSSRNCWLSCIFDAMHKLCGYADPMIRRYNKHKAFPKTTLEMLQCREKFLLAIVQGNVTSCVCPKACEEVRYGHSISQSKWPVDADLPVYKYYAEKLLGIDPGLITDEFMRKSILKVVIYFKDLSVLTLREKAQLDSWDLLGNIGGHLGFWCGASVFSVFEFFAFLIALSFYSVKALLIKPSAVATVPASVEAEERREKRYFTQSSF